MATFANNEARDEVIMAIYKNDEKKIELLRRHDLSLYGDAGNPGVCARVRDNGRDIGNIKEELANRKERANNTVAVVIQIITAIIAIGSLAVAIIK